MSVVVETTLGDITVDLFIKERPRACLNFLKLCKIKYYNYNLFHTVTRRFIAQTGDPTGSRSGGESIFGVLDGPLKRFFVAETKPRIKHTIRGLISFVGNEENMIGSQFFFTLADDLTYLDEKHCVFGEVAEGLDVLELINEAICDSDDRPYQDIRITHTVILDDPLPDLEKMVIPSRSPSPSAERLQGGRIAADEEIDEIAGKSAEEINEMIAEREAKARATILEMVGDLPDADMAPPENVLFVCKLNPVTSDDDLEIIFSRFGKIKSCEVIRDHKTGDSLQYAFIEFEDKKSCEEAYFKMDNVLIDDRRIHVDFSQSVSKVKWMGKGRGVKHFTENGSKKKHDLKETSYNDDNQSEKYSKSGRKRLSRPEYDNGGKYHQKNRSPTRGHRRMRKSRSRSLTPKFSKKKSRRSRSRSSNGRSSSPKHNNNEKGRSLLSDKRYERNTKRGRSRTPENNKTEKRTRPSSSDHKKGYNEVKIKSRSRKSRSPSYKKTKHRKSRPSSTDSSVSSSTSESSTSDSSEHGESRKNRKGRSRSRTSRSSSPETKKNYKKNINKERSHDRGDEKHKRSGSSKYMSASKSHKRTAEESRLRSRSRSQTPRIKKTKNRRSRSRNSRSLTPQYKKRKESSRSSEKSTSDKYKKYRK